VAGGWVAEQKDEKLLPSAAEGWLAEQINKDSALSWRKLGAQVNN